MVNVTLAFAVIAFTYAYLAINTPEKHGALQTLHYLLAHIAVFFTGYLAYTQEAAASTARMLTTWNNAYYAVLFIIFAYFVVHILDVVLQETG